MRWIKSARLKIISKNKVYCKKVVGAVLNEHNILKNLNFPLLVNLDYSFHEGNYVYFIIIFVSGMNAYILLKL
jgi:serine/threonine protein kinase